MIYRQIENTKILTMSKKYRESPSEAMMVSTQNNANKYGKTIYIFRNLSEFGPDFAYTETYDFLAELKNYELFKIIKPDA